MLKRIVAAVSVLAILGLGAPALAGGYGRGHHHGHYHGHYKYRYDGAAVFAGGLLLGALIGHLTAPSRVYVAPPPAAYVPPPPPPALGNCRTVYGTGYVNGRPAEFQGTGCFDAWGNLYVTPGSERFSRYLN